MKGKKDRKRKRREEKNGLMCAADCRRYTDEVKKSVLIINERQQMKSV